MKHPYADAADFQFWSRAMTWPAPGHVDPVTRGASIAATEPVVTLGSCFAQHIARHLSRSGCNYLVTERAPAGMSPAEAASKQFGVFSARYGNVYTVRQALQLVQRSRGEFQPTESTWTRGDGRWVDPFRPQIEPDGFSSVAALEQSRATHLECAKRAIEQASWIVFTLGLTEGWRSKIDGAVYPLAPGVAGGDYDPARHEFVNFGVREVVDDLFRFIEVLKSMNPSARVILTVSPVPLAATYENRHVLVSTVASKSVLRVAADEAERQYSHVLYFPSYEVITSQATEGRYYGDDLRQVNDSGVGHVMRLFSRHFLNAGGGSARSADSSAFIGAAAQDESSQVACDEEAIERSLRQTGIR